MVRGILGAAHGGSRWAPELLQRRWPFTLARAGQTSAGTDDGNGNGSPCACDDKREVLD